MGPGLDLGKARPRTWDVAQKKELEAGPALGLARVHTHHARTLLCLQEFLLGANSIDDHFRNMPLENNLPVLLGLMSVWNVSFLGYPARAILPYCQVRVCPRRLVPSRSSAIPACVPYGAHGSDAWGAASEAHFQTNPSAKPRKGVRLQEQWGHRKGKGWDPSAWRAAGCNRPEGTPSNGVG